MSLLRKLIAFILVLVLLVAAAIVFLPWNKWLEVQLKDQLAEYGMSKLDFTVSGIDLSGVSIDHISLGPDSPFVLQSAHLGYNLRGLINGKVDGLSTGELVVKYHNLQLRFSGLNIVPLPAEAGKPALRGAWTLRDMTVTGLPVALPLLAGEGNISWADGLQINGVIKSADNQYNSDFVFNYPQGKPEAALLKLNSAQMPWNQGMVRTGSVSVPLFGADPINAVVATSNVSLGSLMQQATGGRATASGNLSGKLHIMVGRDGSIMVQKGKLKTKEDGNINLPPDMIPGDHPQVEIVRQILKNFHYSRFSLKIQSLDAKKISIVLALKGNNPDMYEGRMVDLKVNLSGDLLDMLQQGMITIVDPKQLLSKPVDNTKTDDKSDDNDNEE